MNDARWTVEQARQWYEGQPWLVGCNFIPSSAINQLEMWQAETFDPETIDRELGWAAGLGFNSVRVFLHDLLWVQDPAGFTDRLRRYLDIAARHKVRTVFVLFDDCWHDAPRLGKQPEPTPGVHNSGWVKSPGMKAIGDKTSWGRLEEYVQGVVGAFASDERVVMWDVYNEPGNNFLVSLRLPRLVQALKLFYLVLRYQYIHVPSRELLGRAFAWAREAHPSQPLTCGTWYLRADLPSRLNADAARMSDVVSFHSYFDLETTRRIVAPLQAAGRPVLCTEYLARGVGSNFSTHMPWFKEQKIGCYNWGLVSGKTQTMYSWQEYYPTGGEPPLWFHDILHPDGSPYRQEEAQFIRQVTAGIK